MSEPPRVAIDGPVGVGKSTVARQVAARLGVPYLETGAMYRALGLKVLESGIDPEDAGAVEALVEQVDLTLEPRRDGTLEVLVDGTPPGERLRSPEVGEVTSRISVLPGVRRRMVELQRRAAARRGGVLEGRDIGTRVIPETPFKFFLDAPVATRAARRYRQLLAAGTRCTLAEVAEEIRRRDHRDATRKESPLTRDASYRVIDTGSLTPAEVVDRIVAAVQGSGDDPTEG